MRWLLAARERFRLLVFRAREDAEMDEELRFHLEMATERNMRRGLSAAEARRRALLAFGGLERHREQLREGRRWPVVEDLWLDLRYGARSLLRVPGFTATIVLALALGIGTSVAVFSVVRQLVTEAVPFAAPERLFSVELSGPREPGVNPSVADLTAWRGEAASVASLAGYLYRPGAVGDGSHTVYGTGFGVTEGFFPILGVQPLLGRPFVSDDHAPSSPPAVVLSERFWERHFGRDGSIVGAAVQVDGEPHMVLGIVAAGMAFPPVSDFWTPLPSGAAAAASVQPGVIGRLTSGTTAAEARAALQAVRRARDADRPEAERGRRVELLPLAGRNTERARLAVRLLQGTVLLVLLVGIANGAGLMLTRGVLRRREIAVRTALGAGRARVVRQILAESALLAAAGGVLGVGIGWLGIELLRRGLPASMTRQMLGWDQLGMDGGAALFAFAMAVAAALACGLVPALHAVRGDPSAGLREEGAAAPSGRATGRITRLLVVGEVALSLTLLLTGGLLTRSVVELLRQDTGYDARDLLTARWVLPPAGYEEAGAVERVQRQLIERMAAHADVSAVAIVSNLPTAPFGATRRYRVAGSDPDADGVVAAWRPVSPGYLGTMGIDLVGGRPFRAGDGAAAARVAIVDESLAATLAGGVREAVGARIDVGDESWTVVGVARTVVNPAYPGALRRTIYVPQAQAPTRSGFLVVRAARDAGGLAHRVREAVWSLDPAIAIGTVATVEELAADLRWAQRVMAVAIAIFALIALAITIISLYALVAHAVARRQREFGVRLALGADPGRILRAAMAQGLTWVAVGVALGLLLSVGVAGLLTGLLHGVRPLDPAVFGLVTLGVLALALVASYLPARRAARVDPLISLKSD